MRTSQVTGCVVTRRVALADPRRRRIRTIPGTAADALTPPVLPDLAFDLSTILE